MKPLLTIFSLSMLFNFSAFALSDADALGLLKKARCTSCHAVDADKIGPSYQNVSKHYKKPSAATVAYLKGKSPADYLAEKIRIGTKKDNKHWVTSEAGKKFGVMTPNNAKLISDADLKEVVTYILSLK